MDKILKSAKLNDVCYDIRGPVFDAARRLEEEGYRILKLNIGNPAPFGFMTPDEIVHDVVINLPNAQGYSESKGLFSARKAVMQYYQEKGVHGVEIQDIYLGNGVSELIQMSMNGLLNNGDEMLIPAPDYPLWTASVRLAGAKPVHYLCDEQSDWYPDLEDIKAKITAKTRGLVLINPNNPTGAVYSREFLLRVVELAREYKLMIFSDEIYDKILYDGVEHVSIASLCDDLVVCTLGGISKVYRAAGFRAGWLVVSGRKHLAKDFMEGLDILSNMRMCSNVPAQYAIQTALGGYQSINDLVVPGGRLCEQRDLCWSLINEIPGVSCVKPLGAFYLFPKIDIKKFNITDDQKFIMDLLLDKKMLLVQGSGFNWPGVDHFRIVFLPNKDDLGESISRLKAFLGKYSQ